MTDAGVGSDGSGIPVTDESLDDLYENAPCGLLSTSADGTVLKVNATLLALLGYERTDVVGTPFMDLLDAGGQLFYQTRYLPVLLLSGSITEVAFTLRRSDGGTVPVLLNSVAVSDGGRLRLVRTAVFDSTARQDYERELLAARRSAETSEARVRVLQGASSAFTASLTQEAVSSALARLAREAFSAKHASVLLAGDDGLLSADETYPLVDVPDAGPEVEAIATGSVVTVTGAREAIRYPSVVSPWRSARIEAAVVVPLLDEGAALGVLVCFFGRPRDFDEHQIELFVALARQAAQALVRIRLQGQLERLALYDQLTGLANRKLLRERLVPALADAARRGRPIALIVVDLDGFKAVNDRFGHTVGDAVLQQVSERLRSVVRDSDLVGRFGGDEFVVVCEDADERAAVAIATRIGDAVGRRLEGTAADLPVTASIGVAVADVPAQTSTEQMFQAADEAMYRSKRGGKDRVTVIRL